MDFMGIGPLELIVILILAFLFFGPEKLPGMAAKAGKWYRNFTRATSDFSQSLNRELSKELEEEDKKTPAQNAPQSTSLAIPAAQSPSQKPVDNPDEQ
jgi:sec-independent protein translocase protein TatB